MPTRLLESYLSMLPRLQGEESMMAYNVAAVGGAKAKRSDASRIVSQWRKMMQGTKPQRARSVGEYKATLAAMGIAVEGDDRAVS